MVLMQHDDDTLNDEALKTWCTDQENHSGYFLFNTRGRCAEHNLSWNLALVFGLICLDSSDRLMIQEKKFTCTVSVPDRLQKQQLNRLLLGSNEQIRHDDGMELSSLLGQRS